MGEDAFDTGLLIGSQDSKLFGNETADIFVIFPHTTIQEFLGAFYSIFMINEQESIPTFMNPDKPILLTNCSFYQFCMNFVNSSQAYFVFEKEKIDSMLKEFLKQKLDVVQLSTYGLYNLFPASVQEEFEPKTLFDILAMCISIRDVITHEDLEKDIFVPEFLDMPNLLLLVNVDNPIPVIGQFSWLTDNSCDDEFSVVVDSPNYENIDNIINHNNKPSKNSSLYILPTETTDLCKFMTEKVRKVYICGDSLSIWNGQRTTLTAESNIQNCPFLTHLFLM